MSTEIDELKQKLRMTENLLAQEKAKRLAVERDSFDVKRAAQQTMDQANALQAEALETISTGAEHLQVAMGISQGVYAMGQLCMAAMIEQSHVARTLHREQTGCSKIDDLIAAIRLNAPDKIKAAVNAAEIYVSAIRKDSEDIRMEMALHSTVAFRKDITEAIYEAINKEDP